MPWVLIIRPSTVPSEHLNAVGSRVTSKYTPVDLGKLADVLYVKRIIQSGLSRLNPDFDFMVIFSYWLFGSNVVGGFRHIAMDLFDLT